MSMYGIFNLVVFAALLSFLFQLAKKELGLSRRVLIGLMLGSIFGFYLQLVVGYTAEATTETLEWTNVVANIYVNLLRMIIIPLVLITMMASVLKVEEIKSLGKIGGSVVGILVVTTMIAAVIGIIMASLFGLNAGDLASGARELARAEVLESRLATDRSISQLLIASVPSNIFADMAESRATSIIAVAVFGMIIGIAALLVSQEDAEHGTRIKSFVDTTQAVIMRLVKLVIGLTPYGVLALMTRVIATTDGGAIITLIGFVVASYIAIAIMFVVHGLIIAMVGVNVREYFQKVWPVLTFAFATRSSAATIPLTIRAQIEELNVPAPIANISASFGATIGQCADHGGHLLAVPIVFMPTPVSRNEVAQLRDQIPVVLSGQSRRTHCRIAFGVHTVAGGTHAVQQFTRLHITFNRDFCGLVVPAADPGHNVSDAVIRQLGHGAHRDTCGVHRVITANASAEILQLPT